MSGRRRSVAGAYTINRVCPTLSTHTPIPLHASRCRSTDRPRSIRQRRNGKRSPRRSSTASAVASDRRRLHLGAAGLQGRAVDTSSKIATALLDAVTAAALGAALLGKADASALASALHSGRVGKAISGKSSGSLCVQAQGRRSCWPDFKPQRAPALQALLVRLAEDSEAEVAAVALLDRGLQGAPAGEGLWRGLGLGLGLWRSLGHGHGPLGLALLSLPSLSLSSPSSSRGALLTGEPIVAM